MVYIEIIQNVLCVLAQNIEFPESMSQEMRTLLEGLLKREVEDRLGCQGGGLVFLIVNSVIKQVSNGL